MKIYGVISKDSEFLQRQTDLLHIDAVAGAAKNQTGLHRFGKSLGLERDLLLILAGEVDEMVILRANKKWNSRFVEAPTLAIPFLDGVQSAFAGKIKHEKDCNGIIADEWQHINELALATKIPDGERDLRIAN